MTTDELIEYYEGLLIIQYALQPKANATIAAYVRQVIADQIANQVANGFNFSAVPGTASNSAIGAQLDAVASYRGVNRVVVGLNVTRSYFQMPVYGDADADTAPGFAVYGQTPINWFFLNYQDNDMPLFSLTDDEMYRLTQFRALSDSNLLSVSEVDDILFGFFGDDAAVFESGTMTITYVGLITDPDTLFSVVAATGSFPKPAGVRVYVIRSETTTEFFGYQLYGEAINPTFVGYGLYGSPQTGSFVRYG